MCERSRASRVVSASDDREAAAGAGPGVKEAVKERSLNGTLRASYARIKPSQRLRERRREVLGLSGADGLLAASLLR